MTAFPLSTGNFWKKASPTVMTTSQAMNTNGNSGISSWRNFWTGFPEPIPMQERFLTKSKLCPQAGKTGNPFLPVPGLFFCASLLFPCQRLPFFVIFPIFFLNFWLFQDIITTMEKGSENYFITFHNPLPFKRICSQSFFSLGSRQIGSESFAQICIGILP